MKALFFFIIGVFAGGYAVHVYEQHNPPPNPAVAFGDSMADKLRDWHLTPDDIKADLASTGQVVRAKAGVAGGKISDVRILGVIKAKFVLDHDLSARAISVEVADGGVTLSGTVTSESLVGRAVGLALDTDGVTTVRSRLQVQP